MLGECEESRGEGSSLLLYADSLNRDRPTSRYAPGFLTDRYAPRRQDKQNGFYTNRFYVNYNKNSAFVALIC